MALLGAILSTADISANAVTVLTPGTTVTLTVTNNKVQTNAAAQIQTINASGAQVAGQELVLIISNDATPRVITFGTGFRATAILTGTANKAATVCFVSDGTSLFETSRSLVL